MEPTVLILLVVTIVTANGKPNIEHQVAMPSVEICLQEAERFLNSELPEFIEYQGISARCVKRHIKEDHS